MFSNHKTHAWNRIHGRCWIFPIQLDIDTFILFECIGFLATGRLSYDNHMNAVNLTWTSVCLPGKHRKQYNMNRWIELVLSKTTRHNKVNEDCSFKRIMLWKPHERCYQVCVFLTRTKNYVIRVGAPSCLNWCR